MNDQELGGGGFDPTSFQSISIMPTDMTRAASQAPALALQTTSGGQDTVFTGSSLSSYGVGRESVFPLKSLASVYHFSS